MKIQYKKDGSTGWLTLSNPPYNTFTHPVFADKTELVERINDPGLKRLIIRGAGRHFCSGAEVASLQEQAQNPHMLRDNLTLANELLQIISFATIPVAALITGSCLGGGLELALACHFRFAAQNAMFGFPESDHCLMPGMGGTILTQDHITKSHLIDLLLSGRLIRAEEAQRLGIVDKVAPAKNIEEELINFLDTLTSRHSEKLIRTVMQSINNGRRLPVAEALQEETRLFCELAKESISSCHSDDELQ